MLICSWIWDVFVLGFFEDALDVWEMVGFRTRGRGIETSGVKSLDDASSSAPSSIATSDCSVKALCDSSSDEELSGCGFVGDSDRTAGVAIGEFCVCSAGSEQVVDLAAMVNGITKGAELSDNSEVLSLGAMIARKGS